VLTAGDWAFQINGNSRRSFVMGWVRDRHAPGFREEAHRQALLLRGAPEETEAIAFIEAVADTGDSEAASSRSAALAHCPPVCSRNVQDGAMNHSDGSQEEPAAELISKRIAELGDWRGETPGRMRALIKQADPEVVEEWKWRGVPVWSHNGIICTGESYKAVVKLTFAKGASLDDPAGLFNASLDGNVRRAIDIYEGEAVDETAFIALVRQAVALNSAKKPRPSGK
jgi:hypothetical protein